MQFPSGRLGPGTRVYQQRSLEIQTLSPKRSGGMCGEVEVLLRQMRRNNAEIKDFKCFVLGLTQLYSRSRAGLPAAHAGLPVLCSGTRWRWR